MSYSPRTPFVERLSVAGIREGRRLARGLLLLGAVLTYGCVIPEPLSLEPLLQSTHPIILTGPGETTPPPSPSYALTPMQPVTITIVASDDNPNNLLIPRLFIQKANSSTLVRLPTQEVPLTHNDPNDPVRRGTLDASALCALFGTGDALWLYVGNNPFKGDTEQIVGDCCSDKVFWVLKCG